MASVMLHEEEGDLESKMALTAAVMADKSRSRMLCALMDGCAWTATELSAVADISASTASAHLARLCEQRFVVALAQGRHRYFRLAGSDIAELLERLMGVGRHQRPAESLHRQVCAMPAPATTISPERLR